MAQTTNGFRRGGEASLRLGLFGWAALRPRVLESAAEIARPPRAGSPAGMPVRSRGPLSAPPLLRAYTRGKGSLRAPPQQCATGRNA